MRIDIRRLLLLTFAGALAGLFIFLIFNPSMAKEELAGRELLFDEDLGGQVISFFLHTLVLAASFSVMLGGMLVLAEEHNSAPKRIAVRMGTVMGLGAVVGSVAGLLAQFLFMAVLLCTLGLGLIPARIVGWGIMGAGAAVCVGFVLGGWKRARMSTLGGFIGGLIGGALFDVLGLVSALGRPDQANGSVSRFVGFIAIGLVTGAAIAFVEDMVKQSWVTVLRGPKEGRSFILTKPVTSIGRNEMADIPLFGDLKIQKDHARLLLEDKAVFVQSATNTAVTVNGTQTQYAQLKPWDVIGVGSVSLRFHQKAAAMQACSAGQPMPDQTAPQFSPSYASTNRTITQPAVIAATGQLSLMVTAGPHLNQRFQFGAGAVRIGREMGCGILLAQDNVVSRNHAELTWSGTGWTIKDLSSRNGLWVNGVRVTEHSLNIGDQIGVGQSWLKVEGL